MVNEASSKTALLVCACRARASEICADPWAPGLAGPDGMALLDEWLADYPHMVEWIGVRTAWIDAMIARHVGPERPQVVLLGAGLDSRAMRLAAGGLRFFEVDHPQSQAEKLRRIASVDGYEIDAATYVSCDFADEDFLDRLTAVGFRAGTPTFFVWEGVTPYLDEGLVLATLGRIVESTHPRTLVAFDTVRRKFVQGAGDPDGSKRARFVAIGEQIRFGIDDLVPMLHALGYRYVRTDRFDEAALNFTGTYERERAFRFQFITLAGRAPPELP